MFRACTTKVVLHCRTKPCSDRSLTAARTGGQLYNQSLKFKMWLGLRDAVTQIYRSFEYIAKGSWKP